MAPRLGFADVGKFFLGPDDRVWRLVAYCEHPTAEFERLETLPLEEGQTPCRMGGAVDSLLLDPFRRLVPEGD